jgi:hypothetical protein
MGGGTIVPRSDKTKGNKFFFQAMAKFVKIIYDPLYLLKLVFPKFDPLTGMTL